MNARFITLTNGRWLIEVTAAEGGPISNEFICCLTRLTARTVGACIIIEVPDKEAA